MKKFYLFALTMLTVLLALVCVSCNSPVSSSSQAGSSTTTPLPSESTPTSPASSTSESSESIQTSSISTTSLSEATKTKVLNYLKQKYTDTDITILDCTDVGSGYILINFNLATSTNKFLLYHPEQDTYEILPLQDSDLIKVINENYFIFENKGDFTDSAFKAIPYIQYCFRVSNNNGDENFQTINKNEIFDLTRSIQIGSKDNELLSSFIVTADGVETVYQPTSETDAQFYAGVTDIPTTMTSYDENTKQFTIEISTNQINDQMEYNTQYNTDENLYISSYQIIAKDNKTLIILTLRDNANGYTAELKRSADMNEYPYFVLSFGDSPDNQFDN